MASAAAAASANVSKTSITDLERGERGATRPRPAAAASGASAGGLPTVDGGASVHRGMHNAAAASVAAVDGASGRPLAELNVGAWSAMVGIALVTVGMDA